MLSRVRIALRVSNTTSTCLHAAAPRSQRWQLSRLLVPPKDLYFYSSMLCLACFRLLRGGDQISSAQNFHKILSSYNKTHVAGYYLATASSDAVKLWDLRKLRNFKTFTPYEEGVPCGAAEFDHSGLFLAIGGADARICGLKQVGVGMMYDIGGADARICGLKQMG